MTIEHEDEPVFVDLELPLSVTAFDLAMFEHPRWRAVNEALAVADLADAHGFADAERLRARATRRYRRLCETVSAVAKQRTSVAESRREACSSGSRFAGRKGKGAGKQSTARSNDCAPGFALDTLTTVSSSDSPAEAAGVILEFVYKPDPLQRDLLIELLTELLTAGEPRRGGAR